MTNTFQCTRCGACCKPGWCVNKNAGRPYTRYEKFKSAITGKPLPSRVYYVNYTVWLEEDINRAATFLGISFDEFVEKYELSDDTANVARLKNITKDEHLKREAKDRGLTVDELKKKCPSYRSYQLYTAVMKRERNCPFVVSDEAGVNSCSVYDARPKMCRDYPSRRQLHDDFDFYQKHCPGFKKE